MSRVINITRRLFREEEGAVLVEYALLVALIALACIVSITALGTAIAGVFQKVADKLGEY